MGFRAREIDWHKSHVQNKFSWPPFSLVFFSMDCPLKMHRMKFSVLLYGLSTENAPNGRESGFCTALYHLFNTWVFGHEKSIGASPTFKKNFPDPLVVVKTCNVFSKKCYMFSPTKGSWKFFFERGTCANRFLVPENPCIEQVVSSVTTNGSTSIQLLKGGATWGSFSEKHFFSIFDLSRGKIMRKIDCAHSRSVKTLSWPWFREGIGVLKRKSNIFGFLWENRLYTGCVKSSQALEFFN